MILKKNKHEKTSKKKETRKIKNEEEDYEKEDDNVEAEKEDDIEEDEKEDDIEKDEKEDDIEEDEKENESEDEEVKPKKKKKDNDFKEGDVGGTEQAVVVVKNLGIGLTVFEIYEFFKHCGKVVSIRKDKHGNAFVIFHRNDASATGKALAMNGTSVPCTVYFSAVKTETEVSNNVFAYNLPNKLSDIEINAVLSKIGNIEKIIHTQKGKIIQFKTPAAATKAKNIKKVLITAKLIVEKPHGKPEGDKTSIAKTSNKRPASNFGLPPNKKKKTQ